MDYFEKDLEIPFLHVLSENRIGLLMSDIKKILLARLNPTGTCAEPSPTRPGEIKLHQRIGNFTPERRRRLFTKGYVTYDTSTKIYKITDAGITVVNESWEAFTSLISQGFTPAERRKEIDRDITNMIIEEGEQREVSQKQRMRSKRLRELKLADLVRRGAGLECCTCGFNFERKYGGVGKDFIIIHHTTPIHTMDIDGKAMKLDEALKKVVPVCSNCHSIIHRDREKMLTVDELKEIIKRQAGVRII